jgi:PIN domain nuclease of toxin-antitoxin system
LNEAVDAVRRFDELVVANGFAHLPVSHFHGLIAGTYAVDLRDPFDRMLAAQSELESLPLITCDRAFTLFTVQTIW